MRVYHAVDALTVDGDPHFINFFMNSYNEAIRGVPIEQIQSLGGLLSLLNLVEVNHLRNNGL